MTASRSHGARMRIAIGLTSMLGMALTPSSGEVITSKDDSSDLPLIIIAWARPTHRS